MSVRIEQTQAKIALLHHTGGGNLGDDAILDAVIGNIRRRWPEADITVISMNPGDTARRHGVASHPLRRYTWGIGYGSLKIESAQANGVGLHRWFETTRNPAIRLPRAIFGELQFLLASLRTLRAFDVLIVSGGGQLTERSGPWGFPYAIFTWVLMAKASRIPCIFLNVGAGPFNHLLTKFFVRRALYCADYVSFRDEQSKDLAVDIGFTGKSHVFPDNVYSLDLSLPPVSVDRGGQPIVGIAPMPYPFSDPREHSSDLRAAYEDFIGKLSIFASSLVRQSFALQLFSSDIGVDPSSIEDLRLYLRDHHAISMPAYEPIDSVRQLLIRMTEMNYVVTCRFHSIVFAHLLNKPVLAISHHPKVANLMKALGLSKYCVNIRTFSPSQLADTFASLVVDSDAVKKRMAASLVDYRLLLAVQFDDLFPLRSSEKPPRGDTQASPRDRLGRSEKSSAWKKCGSLFPAYRSRSTAC